ncbi:uncharacterized protein LTR77_008298 [Saxophila tyrrhenica]|uniref:Uncharacterized protein n=1 Tax=Saxophila tyrrhenica TaxID=1690608 RepID=A0AAV9P3V1_9PEZI|nr:hypothetical protein LTR77_008298 [Saxophila tyrrhenica]
MFMSKVVLSGGRGSAFGGSSGAPDFPKNDHVHFMQQHTLPTPPALHIVYSLTCPTTHETTILHLYHTSAVDSSIIACFQGDAFQPRNNQTQNGPKDAPPVRYEPDAYTVAVRPGIRSSRLDRHPRLRVSGTHFAIFFELGSYREGTSQNVG